MQRINVPESDKAVILTILSMTDEEADELLTAFRNAKPALRLNVLSSHVASNLARLEAGEVRRIAQLLVTMYRVRAKFNGSESLFLDEILSNFSQEDDNLTEDEKPKAKERLAKFLQLEETVGMVSEFQNALTDYERVYCGAKITTDIRPIFPNKADSQPVASVLVHTLKVGYHEDDEHRDLYFALDASDLKDLRAVLDAAESKGKQLELFLSNSNMHYLNVEEKG